MQPAAPTVHPLSSDDDAAELLSRLMLKLGTSPEQTKAVLSADSPRQAASHSGSPTMPSSVDTVTSPAVKPPCPPMRTAST